MIQCRSEELYTGITTDVKRRFEEHQKGKGAKYLRGRGPLKLVLKKKIGEKSLALKLESQIKKLPRAKKKQLINSKVEMNRLIRLLQL